MVRADVGDAWVRFVSGKRVVVFVPSLVQGALEAWIGHRGETLALGEAAAVLDRHLTVRQRHDDFLLGTVLDLGTGHDARGDRHGRLRSVDADNPVDSTTSESGSVVLVAAVVSAIARLVNSTADNPAASKPLLRR
jgi:hypothetical protein